MALRRSARRRQPRLDPIRWPASVRRATLVRAGIAAALLTVATVLLYAGTPAGSAESCPAAADRHAGAGTAPPSGSDGAGPAADRADGAADGDAGVPAAEVDGAGDGDPAPRRLRLPAGTVGVAVVPDQPAVLGMIRAGDLVDLLTVTAEGRTVATLAPGVLVLSTPAVGELDGTGLYLAVEARQARSVVAAPAGTRFAVVLRP